MAPKFDKLNMLDETRTNWKIKVRVTRMWPSIAITGDYIHAFNLILLDEDNYHIHAFIMYEYWKPFASVILEGKVYEISDFYTKKATGRLRPVSSKICIYFNKSTVVKPTVDDDNGIPMHKFEFVILDQIYNIATTVGRFETPFWIIDVFGVVEDIKPVELLETQYGSKQVAHFFIRNGSYRLKVTVWDEHISSLGPLYGSMLQSPPIIILTSVYPTLKDGSVEIDTMTSTRIYINLDIADVNTLRQRIFEEEKSTDVMLAT